eukprot:9818804-Prorocentrum_lima.AAC.1
MAEFPQFELLSSFRIFVRPVRGPTVWPRRKQQRRGPRTLGWRSALATRTWASSSSTTSPTLSSFTRGA